MSKCICIDEACNAKEYNDKIMHTTLAQKLQSLPASPGVYFHKDASGQIIYVGKAAVLRNRVRQYFQTSRYRDPKTDALVAEIVDVDWIEVDSEVEALFLEAEMIRRYQPQYNILLRDDKSMSYVRIDLKSQAPSVTVTRRPLDDGAEYFGPFLSAGPLRRALKFLRKIFPYSTHTQLPDRGCLQYHLGLCPGPETQQYDRDLYLKNLHKLIRYIRGERTLVVRELEKDMKQLSRDQQFEQAAVARNRLHALQSLQNRIIFSDVENMDLSKDHALYDLTQLLGLEKPPKRIEGYDISHMQGTDTVASMVVFTNGVSDKGSYRKFKMRIPGNDDFAHMNEVIVRRFAEKNIKAWGRPDFVIIDGGKGQLNAALDARDSLGFDVPMVGLAKKFEEIVVNKSRSGVRIHEEYVLKLKGYHTDESDELVRLQLPDTSHLVKLFQRIRDESHRFAVSYHSTLKTKRQTVSMLDQIPTIGPTTRKKLLKTFGSVRGVMQARDAELDHAIGPKKATILRQYLRAYQKGQL